MPIMSLNLLRHVLEADCEDPDCEIHKIHVGLREGTVSGANLAFYLAGAMKMEMEIRHHFNRVGDYEIPRKRLVAACLNAGRAIVHMGYVQAFGCSDCGAPAGRECYPEYGCTTANRTVR